VRTLFQNAAFARFELGSHALGQAACPVGTAPMSRNGRVECVEFSPPSGMFQPNGPVKSVAYGSLGQAGIPTPYLTQEERDKMLLDIQGAQAKVGPIDRLRNWGTANDPGLKKYLGNDAARFNTLVGVVTPLYQTVSDIATRLADTDAESWWRPSDEETAAVRQWVINVGELYKIIQNHKANIYTPAAGTQPPPPPESLTVEVPQESGIAGISKEKLVLGGAIVLGLGVLILATT